MGKRKKLSCKEIFSYLSSYIDKELDDSLCEQINKHTKNCKSCRAFLKTLYKTIKLCKKFKPEEIPYIRKVELRKDLEKEIESFLRFIQTNK